MGHTKVIVICTEPVQNPRAHSVSSVPSRGRELGTCIALTALQGLVSRRNWTMLFALTYSRYPELLRT